MEGQLQTEQNLRQPYQTRKHNSLLPQMIRAQYILTLAFLLSLHQLGFSQGINLLAMGFQKLEVREYNEAINLFSQVLVQEPRDTAALSGIIRASLLSNNLKDAQKHIENAIRYYPNNSEFYLREGILYNLKGEYAKATNSFDKGIEFSGGSISIQLYINRGVANMQTENYDDAVQDFTDALENNPRNSSALNYRAFANYRLGMYEEAIADYNKAIDLNPDNATAYYNRGMAHLRSGDKIKACPDFHKACSLGNKNACRMIMTECAGGKM